MCSQICTCTPCHHFYGCNSTQDTTGETLTVFNDLISNSVDKIIYKNIIKSLSTIKVKQYMPTVYNIKYVQLEVLNLRSAYFLSLF